MTNDGATLELLPEPYEFWTPRAGVTFHLLVVRFELGLATRKISEPPFVVTRPTIRLHVPPDRKPGRPPYWDFTSVGLAQRIIALWRQAQDRAVALEVDRAVSMLEATSHQRERPLPIAIRRVNEGGEILYEATLGRGEPA